MTDSRRFILAHDVARARAVQCVREAPEHWTVTVSPPKRTGDQNAKFHAICTALAHSDVQWAGKRRTASEWKVLLVSGHATATKEATEVIPGLEGEFINVRESTALMSKQRGASLIDYAEAFCALHGVQ